MATHSDDPLAMMETSLRQVSGTVTALEYAVKMLIVTHPDRARLAHAWRSVLPEQLDEFMKNPAFDNATTRDAITRMLSDLLGFVEMKLPDPE